MAKKRTRKQIGTIGVDAGMCWIGDPCYIERVMHDGYDAFLRAHIDFDQPEQVYQIPAQWETRPAGDPNRGCLALIVGTGYGDGQYPVTATVDEDGRVLSVTVTFVK